MTEPNGTPSSNDAPPAAPFSILKWLGQMRDGFLVAGALLYGIGYAVWSYNAWRNGLGQLPALDLQYVVAGVVPALIGIIAWLGLASGHRIGDWLKRQIKAKRLSSKMLLVVYFIFAILISTIALPIEFGWLHGSRGRWVALAYIAPFVAAIAYTQTVIFFPFFFPDADAAVEPRHITSLERIFYPSPNFVMTWNRVGWTILFFVSAMFAYLDAYPRLPQILGGPEPRCAYVDLLASHISAESRAVFLPAGAATSVPVEAPVHSRRLQVYFSGSDYLLVRPSPQVPDGKKTGEAEPVYTLRNDVIRVVKWCDQ